MKLIPVLGGLFLMKLSVLGLMLFLKKTYLFLVGTYGFGVEGAVKAQVVLDMPFLSSNDTAYCILPRYIAQVLVVKQAELYFAVPYSTLDKIEGVCSRMPAPPFLGEKYLA